MEQKAGQLLDRNWFYTKSKCDPCVYIKAGLIFAIYVDDFLIFYIDEAKLVEIKRMLNEKPIRKRKIR